VDDAGGELALDRLAHLGDVVAEHVREDAAEEVQVGVAGGVGDAGAGAADELQGVLVVQGHPGWEYGAVALEEFRHVPQSGAYCRVERYSK